MMKLPLGLTSLCAFAFLATAPAAELASPSDVQGSSPRFADLGILERSAYFEKLRKQDLASIFSTWLAAGRVEHDRMKQQAVGALLGLELRKRPPDLKFYRLLQEFVDDSSNSSYERGQFLVNALRETRTKESLDLLIHTATNSTDAALRNGAIEAIGSVGASWGDGKDHEELSPALERVWPESKDLYTASAVALAMAKVGAPSGIKLLVSAVLASGPQSDFHKQAALIALPEVRNPHAVPILSGLFDNLSPISETSKLASSTLAEMGDPVAAQALLSWLQTADASAAPLALSYVAHVRSSAMLEAYEAALNPGTPFRAEQVREAIRAGLVHYKASYRKK